MRGAITNAGAIIACVAISVVSTPMAAQPTSAANPALETRAFEVTKILHDFHRGQLVGKYKQGLFCGPLGGSLEWNVTWIVGSDKGDFEGLFWGAMEAAGFRNAGKTVSLFDDSSTVRSEYLVGGVIENMDLNLCFPRAQLGDNTLARGSGTMEVKWEVFSKRGNKVVATIRTQGSGEHKESVSDGGLSVVLSAFADNVRKLSSEGAFRAIFVADPDKPIRRQVAVPRGSIIDLPPSARSAAKMTDAIQSTVMIFSGDSFGSGFLISSDGHVLTNHHVLNGNQYVKVRWSDGVETLGEVVRSDEARDVALIKSDARDYLPIRIRTSQVSVGEDVFAIGAPLDPQMQNSVTKGIISSANRMIDGQRYIQSDVSVNSGNSGGPLIDQKAELVGMTVSGIEQRGVPVGINLFIPMSDAVASLGIRFKAAK